MKTGSEYFGEVEYEADEVITFQEGLYGFENYHDFLPIPFEEESDTLLYLQSLEDFHLSFILMNPFSFFPEYQPVLEKKDYVKLETDDEKDLSYYVLCVIGEHAEECRVNLRCPIVVNAITRKAVQVVLPNTDYPFQQPLGKSLTGGMMEC